MTISSNCTNCGNADSEGAAYCSSCGQARVSSHIVDQSNNQNGFNVQAGGNVQIGDTDRWDTRPRALMDREHKRPVWPVDWVSTVSAIITIASFLGIGSLPDLTIPLGIVGVASGAVAFTTLSAAIDLRSYGSHVLPRGLGTLERADNGSTWLTEPIAQCPFCPEHKPGIMRVERTPNGPQWVCANTPNHRDGFDGTQMPPIFDDATEAA
ncbi:hypothetical protein [Zhihengliuella halotolerans]|uniref:hypothetical protein n=1 Tax=Zhihengliuella halotolerans TaxID=370736 RepID=UPI0011AF8721|nr:hypothetical protein [Zhihengliuella halotolerans]